MRNSAFMAQGKLMCVPSLLVGGRWRRSQIVILQLFPSQVQWFVNGKSDIAISKSMHPLAESSVVSVRVESRNPAAFRALL
jgi:hypothetical protein